MRTDLTFRLHVCPQCAAPIEVEGGYDGPYYEWSCDHEWACHTEPQRMTLDQWADPQRRESLRKAYCMVEWQATLSAYRHKREAYDTTDFSVLHHPKHKDSPHYYEWTPEYRRARKWWRDNGGTTEAFSAVMKDVWRQPIVDALNARSPFMAAMLGEQRDALVDTHRDFNRTAIGNTFTVPLQSEGDG